MPWHFGGPASLTYAEAEEFAKAETDLTKARRRQAQQAKASRRR